VEYFYIKCKNNPMSKANKIDGAILERSSSIAVGKELRKTHPLNANGMIKARPKDFDSNAILEISNEDRLAELIPIPYGRMLVTPFTFLRGSAALMADDFDETLSSR